MYILIDYPYLTLGWVYEVYSTCSLNRMIMGMDAICVPIFTGIIQYSCAIRLPCLHRIVKSAGKYIATPTLPSILNVRYLDKMDYMPVLT
jgi:hypothetical protein